MAKQKRTTLEGGVRLNVTLAHLRQSFEISEQDLAIAQRVLLDKAEKPAVAAEFGRTERSVRRCLDKVRKFGNVMGYSEKQAVEILSGLEDTCTVSPSEVQAERVRNLEAANQTLVSQLTREKVKTEAIVEALVGNLGYIDPTPYPEIPILPANEMTPEYAIAECGDWHFGSQWGVQDVGAWGPVNADILAERVELYATQLVYLVKLQRKARPIPWLVCNLLGDFIENEIMRHNQGVSVEMNSAKQMARALAAMEKFLITMLDNFEEVFCPCVWGNHGRMGVKRNDTDPQNNWDLLLYAFLAERFKNEPRIKFFISTTPWIAYTLPHAPNWTHVAMHGDGLPSRMGIPWYSIERDTGRVAELLNQPIHFIHLGHFHSLAKIDKPYGKKLVNGCLSGTSPYAIKLHLGGVPKQLLFGLHPKRGISWSYEVYLSDQPHFEADVDGIITPHVQSLGQLGAAGL